MSASIGRIERRKAKREQDKLLNARTDPTKPLIFRAHGGYEHIGCGGAAWRANQPGLASCDRCERVISYEDMRRV